MFICEKNYSCCDFKYWDRLEDVEQEARECEHLIEVIPVVHGHWENVCHYPYPDTIRCSVCGREFNGNEDWKGCPVCLARMDGE